MRERYAMIVVKDIGRGEERVILMKLGNMRIGVRYG